MSIPKLVLTNQDMELLLEFMDRRRKKYDTLNGKLYHIVWTTSAKQERERIMVERRKAIYREKHPKKESTAIDETMSYYLRKKIGLLRPVGRPPLASPRRPLKSVVETSSPGSVDLLPELVL
jgi:hypothetical protein